MSCSPIGRQHPVGVLSRTPTGNKVFRRESGTKGNLMNETDRNEATRGTTHEHIELVSVDAVDPNPYQPRRTLGHMAELTESVKAQGVLVPIRVVRRRTRYRIVYGERRWRAAKEAGLGHIPCLVCDSDVDSDELSLIENEQRENLSLTDHVMAVREFLQRGYTHQDIATIVGKSESHISKCLSAGEFLSEALAGGFLTYEDVSDVGLEHLYLAALLAKQEEDVGIGADLLLDAVSSHLSREEMARLVHGAPPRGKKGLSRSQAKTSESSLSPPLQRRWQITLANPMTGSRMARMLDTVADMAKLLSSLATITLVVDEGDKTAVGEAFEKATRSLTLLGENLGRLRERALG